MSLSLSHIYIFFILNSLQLLAFGDDTILLKIRDRRESHKCIVIFKTFICLQNDTYVDKCSYYHCGLTSFKNKKFVAENLETATSTTNNDENSMETTISLYPTNTLVLPESNYDCQENNSVVINNNTEVMVPYTLMKGDEKNWTTEESGVKSCLNVNQTSKLSSKSNFIQMQNFFENMHILYATSSQNKYSKWIRENYERIQFSKYTRGRRGSVNINFNDNVKSNDFSENQFPIYSYVIKINVAADPNLNNTIWNILQDNMSAYFIKSLENVNFMKSTYFKVELASLNHSSEEASYTLITEKNLNKWMDNIKLNIETWCHYYVAANDNVSVRIDATVTDFDECIKENNICPQNSMCINTLGSFSCLCEPGYFGDGIKCSRSSMCDKCQCEHMHICAYFNGEPICLKTKEAPKNKLKTPLVTLGALTAIMIGLNLYLTLFGRRKDAFHKIRKSIQD